MAAQDPTNLDTAEPARGAPRAERSPFANQLVLLVAFVLRALLALLTTALLGRELAPEHFGFFALVGTLFVIAHETMNLGTMPVAVREIVRRPEGERELLEHLLGWRRSCAVALALGVVVLAWLEPAGPRRYVLLGVAASLYALLPWGLHAVFQVRQALAGPALATVVGQGVVLVGALTLDAWEVAGPLFALLVLLREVLVARWIRVLAVRRLGAPVRPRGSGRELGGVLWSSLALGGATVLHMLYVHVDVLLVDRVLGGEALGTYVAASRPMTSLMGLPALLAVPLLPLLSAAVRTRSFVADTRSLGALFTGLGLVTLAVGLPLARDGLEVLYAGRYLGAATGSGAGGNAVPVVRWLLVALAAAFAMTPLLSALIAAGRERALLALAAAGLVANVAGNLLVLPHLGITGAAQVTAWTDVGLLLGAGLLFLRSERAVPFARGHLWALLPAALLAPLAAHLPGTPSWRIALGVLLVLSGGVGIALLPGMREGRRVLGLGGDRS